MSKTNRTISYFIDDRGNRCALVPLANCDRFAILYAYKLAELEETGISLNWQLNSNGHGRTYVKLSLPGRDGRVVARLIAGAAYKQQVHYLNGDPLDLRCDNLLIGKGGKAHKDCSTLPILTDLDSDWESAE
ncbi:hypothetical protein N790_10005 [Arenimonas malthae CC-JY-1]|uniref:Uncharacterized protein n=1 Tax=Arenimonas malthae CC-JY-1 TaxID=1384054 RepID=A0A091B3E8_9GAMM|nr:hypothetical protein [Arenimonas malthae]KFN45384.1 hypothetical protein N790_10005 [Arenimonas malthae CC-JY-1]